jgi:predicted NUDIX family NTP pyrophosphohydrolase
MPVSSGLMIYHKDQNGTVKVLLLHPGGPFFVNKDKGSWTIPKGIPDEGESLLDAAKREFNEETGYRLPRSETGFIDLGEVKQKGGKIVHCFALEHQLPDSWEHKSNTFELEWPPRSGKFRDFPEMDQARFFNIEDAKEYINEAQADFLNRLRNNLGI